MTPLTLKTGYVERTTAAQIPTSIVAQIIKRDRKCSCGSTRKLRVFRKAQGKDYEVRCTSCRPDERAAGTRERPKATTRKSTAKANPRLSRSQLVADRADALETFEAYARALYRGTRPPRGPAAEALLRARRKFDAADRALLVANHRAGLDSDAGRETKPRLTVRRVFV